MNGTTAYILARKYTKDSLEALGAIKGAPCEVDMIEKIDGVTTITLKWTDASDRTYTQSFDINDGVSITNSYIDNQGRLMIELSDGRTLNCGKVYPQAGSMPSPSEENIDVILQYTGPTTNTYKTGYFYKCVQDINNNYIWENIPVQDSYTKEEIGDITTLPIAGKDVIQNINEIYQELFNDENEAKMLTGVLLANGWNNKTQVVTVEGLDGIEDGVIGLSNTATPAEIEAARNAILTVVGINGSDITIKCEEVPDTNITFAVLIPGDWVAGGGGIGGGNTELANDLTASVTVGGIQTGKNYHAGTSLERILIDLLNPVLYPTFTNPSGSLLGSGSKLLEVGSSVNVILTATLNRGSISPAYGTSGYRAGAATGYTLNNGTKQSSNTWNQTVNKNNKSFRATIDYAAGEQPKDSSGSDYNLPLFAGSVNTNTVTYEFVEALWANTNDITTVEKLPLISKSAKQIDLIFPAQSVANPEQFDIPTSWTVTGIQVKNDLSGSFDDATGQFTVSSVDHNDALGDLVGYKRYSCNLGYSTGIRTVRVKWS